MSFASRLLLSGLLLALTAGVSQVRAQKAPVRVLGRVIDHNSRYPLPNVAILRKGTRFGTSTDTLGSFRLMASPADTLMLQLTGYKPGMYVIPPGTIAAEFRILLTLEADTTMLKEVRVSNRPSPEKINRALRNMKRKEVNPTENPNPTAVLPPKKENTRPVEPSLISSPASALYEQFSKAGKERARMAEIKKQEAAQKAEEERQRYNNLFLDKGNFR